jgi:lipoprotein-releasing system permease protein
VFGAFERAVAGRYLRARKGERFVSIIAVFSLVGIALGVATLIVVTSVMSGFQTALITRFLGANGHISIHTAAGGKIDGYGPLAEKMRAVPGVVSVLPVLDGQALLSVPGGGARGAVIQGVTASDLRGLPAIADHIVAGRLADLAGDNAIMIGVGIANYYRLGIGANITLISPNGAPTAFGSVPRVRAYRVVAIFDAGISTFNDGVAYLPLPMAQIFFQKPDAVTGFEIRVADPEHLQNVIRPLAAILHGLPLYLTDWRHANDQLIGVLQVQKDTMFIVLGMIILVAAFNVVSSLIMLVKDKRADIAVLRTLGASSGAILRIFLLCGAFVGVSGTLIGTIIGVVFCHYIDTIQHWIEGITGGQVFDSSVFLLTALPNSIDWADVARVVALGLVLSLLATIYPSWRAARTDPVEALRHG